MLWRLLRRAPSRKPTCGKRNHRSGHRPRLEALEDRLAPALEVSSFVPTSAGFVALFNVPINPSGLNLYDTQTGSLGQADAVLTRAGTGDVAGSLVVAPSGNQITFLRTGGILLAGNYTVTLRSAANGFRDTTGGLLDGNRDGTPGDNFTTTFTVPAAPAAILSVPDFARGPGQPVDVPADRVGLPVRLSEGNGVRTVTFRLLYNPALLTISGATGVPAGSTVTLDTSTTGVAVVNFNSPTPLAAGPVELLKLTATVPTNAPYGAQHVLDLTDLQVNTGSIAVIDDDGVHVAAYFGETSGNRQYSALDAQRALRVATGLDSGFAAFPVTDPVVLADITGNGSLSSLDATRILQESVGIDRPELPPLPAATPTVSIMTTDPSASEPGSDTGMFTITRTGSTSAPLTVNYTISGTATNGGDYRTIPLSVTIPAGATSAAVAITPLDDSLPEGNETVILTLASDSSYVIGTPGSATVTIADNDVALRTFYVSPSGSDGGSGSSTSPWRTLQFAANQVRAGDLVIVRAGNYQGFNLVASGTAANRITFFAEPGAVINTPLSLSGNLYGINGSGREYLTIDGFTFAPQTGQGEWYTAIRLGGTPGAWVRGNIIRNNTAQMRVVGQSTTPDKYGIYSSWNDGLLVENNTVSGTYNSGIYVANSSRNYIVRGNHIFNGGGNGIHNNGDLSAGSPGINFNGLIENNVIHNVGFGIGGQAISCDGVQNSRIQNNLLYDLHAKGISLYVTNGAAGSRFNFVVNNTVLVAADGQVPLRINHDSSSNIVLNNIFQAATSSRAWVDGEESGLVGSTIDYNVTTGVALVGGVRRTDWGSSYGFDTHSVVSTPTALFVSPSGNDYHLLANSPAVNAGTSSQAPARDRDDNPRPSGAGVDIGAYEYQFTGPIDTTPPTATMTNPAPGSTLAGTITMSANASDDVGVVGVQFLVDGVTVASEDTTASYSVSWDSTTVANGSHTLAARARDAAGNTTTSAAITVTVSNPTVTGGLVASYNFNEGSGTTLLDRSGNGQTGSISGATWSSSGRSGGALSFDGVNDWVTVNDSNLLDLSNGMTLEAWVRPTSLAGWTTVLLKEAPGGMAYALYASDDTSNPPAGYVNTGGSDQSARAGSSLTLNTWVHLATTYDGSTLRMYVNGVLVGSRSVTGPIISTGGSLRIGGNAVWGEYFAGLVDDVRIYNRALNASEIQADMNTPVS